MSRRERLGWLLVAVQFLLLGTVTVPFRARWRLPAVLNAGGWVVCAGGVVLAFVGAVHLGGALTPQPVPRPTVGVVADGVYRLVRHPIYTGLLFYGTGSVLAHPHPATLVGGCGLFALLLAKARWEESMLVSTAPGYRRYAQRTGRFLPGIGRLRE